MLTVRMLTSLARRENAEALRQPSHIRKNVNRHIEMNADRTGKAIRKSNEALKSALTNLRSNLLASEKSLTGTRQWRTARSVAASTSKDRFLSQRLRCSCHAFKDLAEAFHDVTP